MLSDVLFDAVQDIRRWQNEQPGWYDDIKEEIEKVVAVMKELQEKLDKSLDADIDASRKEVAEFAGYAVGSVMGDYHPAVAREHAKVLRDDGVFREWRDRKLCYERDIEINGAPVQVEINGAPVDESPFE